MMTKDEALRRLKELEGVDLHTLTERYGITFRHANGKINKGWAGQVIERHLGLDLNTSRSPNLGSWELKQIPLNYKKDGKLRIKETMAITMIDPVNVLKTPFEESHLLTKLQRVIVVARIVGEDASQPTTIHKIATFKLKGKFYKTVEADYELVKKVIKEKGFDALTGRMGEIIQPRTKGKGKDAPKTRAFYAHKHFIGYILNIDSPPKRRQTEMKSS